MDSEDYQEFKSINLGLLSIHLNISFSKSNDWTAKNFFGLILNQE